MADLEQSLARIIRRRYRSDDGLTVADIRRALKNTDRKLLVLLVGDVPQSPLAPAWRKGRRSKRMSV